MTNSQVSSCHRHISMERSQKRRIYFLFVIFPKHLAFPNVCHRKRSQVCRHSSGLVWHPEGERQPSLELNSPYCLLCHPVFAHYFSFTLMSLSLDAGPAPLLLSLSKGNTYPWNTPVSQLYSKHTGHSPVHFACQCWDLPPLFIETSLRQCPVMPSLSYFLSCRPFCADSHVWRPTKSAIISSKSIYMNVCVFF